MILETGHSSHSTGGDRYYMVRFEDNGMSRKVHVKELQSRPGKNQVIYIDGSESSGRESSGPGDRENSNPEPGRREEHREEDESDEYELGQQGPLCHGNGSIKTLQVVENENVLFQGSWQAQVCKRRFMLPG